MTTVVLPLAVYREVTLTDLLPQLLAISWIEVRSPSSSQMHTLLADAALRQLGGGEQEAMALAREPPGAVLLMNDNRALRLAASQGGRW